MTHANTNAVAKVAATIAGLGLVAMTLVSAIPASAATASDIAAQIAALQAQLTALTGSAAASTTFTVDLHVGSTGADVKALQSWLISGGYSIPAGATGTFGPQTKAAVAAWQKAMGISPAAGFFGPISRAKANGSAGTGTGTSTGTGSTTGLTGSEARITNFDLKAEDGTIYEGDTNRKIATVAFDVNGGDLNVQRAQLEFQATNATKTVRPWKYINTVTVWQNGKKLAMIDASNQDNWDRTTADSDHAASTADYYMIEIPNINAVVRNGSTDDQLSFSVDAAATIDSTDQSQTFKIDVPANGIRGIDAVGIQQYTGKVSDTITEGFSAAQNGKLTVTEASSDPAAGVLVADTTNESDSFTVFAFNLRNTQSGDSKITDLKFNVATGTAALTSIVRTAKLDLGGKTYTGTVNAAGTVTFKDMTAIVPANGSITGTMKVTLYGQSGHYGATGESILFSLPSTGVTAEGASTGDSVTSGNLSGTATGKQQSIAVNGGINVTKNSNTAVQTYNTNTVTASYGTFTLKFNVAAVGSQDVYIPKTIDTAANTSGHTASSTYVGVVADSAMAASTTSAVVTTSLTTTASSDNSMFYVVHAGNTETFTATVTINPVGLSTDIANFQVGLDKVKFSTSDTDLNSLQTLDIDQTNADFHTDPITISG